MDAALSLPPLVRVKPGALERIGIYLRRAGHRRPLILVSDGLPSQFDEALRWGLTREGISTSAPKPVREGSFEAAVELFTRQTDSVDSVIGLGGGRAIDVAKYAGFLMRKPFYSVPTSLSNDGFCSPQSSLTVNGEKKSLPSALPYGVVVDTQACLTAPRELWLSGVGDLAAKLTAIADWKLAFHNKGTPVNDFAALLSDATVMQFIARPEHDLEGLRLLATSLLLNGIAIQIAGSSRPASGSEHLISHALDKVATRPRLHGLQVGVATYLVSRLQGGAQSERIARLFDDTGFWKAIQREPFDLNEWREALKVAPSLKENFYTILSHKEYLREAEQYLTQDSHLAACFLSAGHNRTSRD